jgi:hypothetical protein
MKKQTKPKTPTDIEVLQSVLQDQLRANLGAQLTEALATGIMNIVTLKYAQHLAQVAMAALEKEKDNVSAKSNKP